MARDVEATLEDLEWMDQSRVGAFDAAERAKFPSAQAMEKWLERHDRYDLWLRFKKRDPEGAHTPEARGMETTTIDATARLLADAAKSGQARIRNKGERIASLIAELRDQVAADVAEQREKDRLRTEVEKLERQLADARARLRGTSYKTSELTTSAREIREWAQANSVMCPTMGKIPTSVREAFEAAQSERSA